MKPGTSQRREAVATGVRRSRLVPVRPVPAPAGSVGRPGYRGRLRARAAVLTAGLALLVSGPGGLRAQGAESVLHGSVLDATSGHPVVTATVVLEPEHAGAFPGAGAGLTAAARTTSTDGRGHYRFGELTPGTYRLYVTRLGYRSYSMVVSLKGATSSVSVGLEAEPIALEPVQGRTRPRGPYAEAEAMGVDPARLHALALRRQQYLTTDVRELTRADVVEGVTLGEPDIFRALQRLPGVTTRSDYTAELWTRGAPWSQTRVYYDGIPLYNPLHALGMLSGVGSGSLRTVWFHPGVRPSAMAEGAAGALDLQSRQGTGTGELNLQGDLSLLTAGVALDQRVLDGQAGWRLSARRSYLDWLSRMAQRAAGGGDPFPYSFNEVSGHVDAWVGARSSVSASFLWEGDQLASRADLDPIRADWGNTLLQGTWTTRIGGLNIQHTAGLSENAGVVDWPPEAVDISDGTFTVMGHEALSDTRIRYLGVRGTVWPDPAGIQGPRWTAGYELSEQAVEYTGPFPLPFPRTSANTLVVGPEGAEEPVSVGWKATLPILAVWGETTWAPTERWSLRAGIRAETGEQIENAASLRLAPRLSARYSPAPDLSLSAGYARVYQHAQSLAPSGVQLASLVSTDVWLLAGPYIPAIQADVLTAGLEASIAPGRIAALNVFGRASDGVAVPDPRSGPVFERDLFRIGESTAYGVEMSVRQLTGPVTGSVGYSWTRSRMSVGSMEFPAAADRPHVLDATAMVRVLDPLRFGAAFTAATGVPYTQVLSSRDACAQEPRCDPDALPWSGEPNAFRAPTFASLDLLVDWSTRWAGLEVGVYGQLRNVLGRENAVVYTGNSGICVTVGCSMDDLRNAYEQGVPRLPVVGIRVGR